MSSIGTFMVRLSIGRSWIGAMSIKNPSYSDIQTRFLAFGDAVKYMGFNSIDEYVSMYPGKFEYGTEYFDHYASGPSIHQPDPKQTPKENFLMSCCSVEVLDYYAYTGGVEDAVAAWFGWCAKERCGEAFMIPMKTDKIKKAYGFKSVPKKRLWFCDDWVEE